MFSKLTSRVTPAQIIILGFLGLILVGALLLTLPFATRDGLGAPFLDALFTSTSATCVTGLVVHDTHTYWSEFGQLVILALIQVGGMGVVTVAVAVALLSGKRIGLRQRFVMQESISAPQVGGIVRMTDFILKTMFLIEGTGALILAVRFSPGDGADQGHLVRAVPRGVGLLQRGLRFDGVPPAGLLADPLCGRPGGESDGDGADRMRRHRLSGVGRHQQKQAALPRLPAADQNRADGDRLPAGVSGGVLLFVFEFGAEHWGLTTGQRIWASLFQTVSPRTAGFNTVDYAVMSGPGLLVTILLMLIGGSPGSTAGGAKTTSLAMIFLSVRSVFQRRDSIQCFGRRLPPEVLQHLHHSDAVRHAVSDRQHRAVPFGRGEHAPGAV